MKLYYQLKKKKVYITKDELPMAEQEVAAVILTHSVYAEHIRLRPVFFLLFDTKDKPNEIQNHHRIQLDSTELPFDQDPDFPSRFGIPNPSEDPGLLDESGLSLAQLRQQLTVAINFKT